MIVGQDLHLLRSFAEVSKNLVRYTDMKVILLDYQNNYVICRTLKLVIKISESFAALPSVFEISVYNYFGDPTKYIISCPYLAIFRYFSRNFFFPVYLKKVISVGIYFCI